MHLDVSTWHNSFQGCVEVAIVTKYNSWPCYGGSWRIYFVPCTYTSYSYFTIIMNKVLKSIYRMMVDKQLPFNSLLQLSICALTTCIGKIWGLHPPLRARTTVKNRKMEFLESDVEREMNFQRVYPQNDIFQPRWQYTDKLYIQLTWTRAVILRKIRLYYVTIFFLINGLLFFYQHLYPKTFFSGPPFCYILWYYFFIIIM